MKKNINYFGFPGMQNVEWSDKIDLWELSRVRTKECLDIVRDVICEHYEITSKNFHSSERFEPFPAARQVFCWIVRIELFSHIYLRVIGEYIGINPISKKSYDHTTVVHGINQVKNMLFTGEITQQCIDNITELSRIKFAKLWGLYQYQKKQIKL
jgi:chromosomal replication initiation ATPase DnaA